MTASENVVFERLNANKYGLKAEYICEQTFSLMNLNKTRLRSSVTDTHLQGIPTLSVCPSTWNRSSLHNRFLCWYWKSSGFHLESRWNASAKMQSGNPSAIYLRFSNIYLHSYADMEISQNVALDLKHLQKWLMFAYRVEKTGAQPLLCTVNAFARTAKGRGKYCDIDTHKLGPLWNNPS